MANQSRGNRSLIKKLFGEISRQEGITLPLVLVLLLAGALLIIPSLDLFSTGLNANLSADEADRGLYAADAGVEKALWHIENDDEFDLPGERQIVTVEYGEATNGNSVEVTVENTGALGYKILSTATDEQTGAITSITTYAKITTSSTTSIFDYAAASLNGDVDITGAVHVFSDPPGEGDIFANMGDVYISGSSHIEGNAAATGEVNSTGATYVGGLEIEGAAPINADVIRSELNQIAAETITAATDIVCPYVLTTGDWVVSASGTYPDLPRIQGDLKIVGDITVTFPGPVCVGGNLEVPADAIIVFEDKVKVDGDVIISGATGSITFNDTLYSGDDLVISGTNEIIMQAPVYFTDRLAMSGSGIRGGATLVAGGDITLSGNGELADVEDLPFIISQNGNVDFTGSNVISAVVCAPNGQIDLSGDVSIYGSVIGDTVVQITGSVEIEYPAELENRDDLPQGPSGQTTGVSKTAYSITRSDD